MSQTTMPCPEQNPVVFLDDFRKTPSVRQTRNVLRDGNGYHCISCGSNDFRLFTDKSVKCSGCGSRITNLSVEVTLELPKA